MATKTVATRKRRAWTTTVFVKQLMAISGIVFVLFLLFHSYGNLKMFLGQEAYDHYAHWLKEEAFVPIFPHGGFIWVFRAAMVLMLVIHIWAAAVTWKRSRRARRSAYVVKRSAADAYAARTMRMTGVLLFFLIVFHILHFTTGTIRTGFVADSTPYERMVATFQNPLMVVVYLIFVGLAALHVSHGFWSAFQSLGWVRGGTRKFMEVLSGLVGALIFLMFALPPLAIVAGYIS
ncbi:succinate dehydrogenase cytochrome b subunit [Actinomyces sp. oral taxon 181]|jgi:succinate dehydrogenase cytochrome B subunit, b558 family|uniref:succinate dehydrogenase cytochrome b subunit n=1 Tax=Actinomyces sp. oral taxon 181 TaxID=712121 RepID=UPI0002A38714|nr:succinate dehydrogenase cytochrome b subunit [Actinomyces sp. oral taxon 181]MBF0943981.1 succinate dehydrogenase cytochrome b subunit [Actinomyces sp.]MBF1737506.1 succinate dehydrogenase cytochrome b subunit [Trueperella pyogenes]EKY15385.1 succinate dehydrogenase cytochrome B subunit, b558 family [Actinomyces sp. oral taxon 181 str. F0379]MBF0973208.1 succinate dehydrogenase cytochrome b subunit [Actinomyces sp.]MBS5340797.1 succinate dehydrogenase cytochrome b subunit [Actinomyces sp. o